MRKVTPTLKSADLAATLRFYRDLLGFTVDTLWPDADAPSYLLLDHGPVSLAFYRDEEGREGAPALTGQLYLDVDDARAVLARLEGHAEPLWGPEVYHYGRLEFAVRDPDGTIVTFGQPVPDPPDRPEDPDARR